jgi:hypothetical protein
VDCVLCISGRLLSAVVEFRTGRTFDRLVAAAVPQGKRRSVPGVRFSGRAWQHFERAEIKPAQTTATAL